MIRQPRHSIAPGVRLRRLPVRSGRHEPVHRGIGCERALEVERNDRVASLVPGRVRRHRQPHVLAQEGDEPRRVASLPRLHVAREERLLRFLGVGGSCPLEPSRRKPLLHRCPRPLQRAVRGGDTHSEHGGCVVGGPVERVPENQDRALARRQMLDRREKRELDRLPCDDHLVRLGALVEKAVRVRLKPRQVSRRLRRRPERGWRAGLVRHEAPRSALEDPETRVRGDPIEPGAERRASVVGRAAAPCTEQRVLDGVLGILERPEHPVGVHLELAAMALGQRRERGAVTVRRGGDEALVQSVYAHWS